MKNIILLISMIASLMVAQGQTAEDQIRQACTNYLEGFYEGDTTKLIKALRPSLYKIGFWKDKDTGEYGDVIKMPYKGAMKYAKRVLEKKDFPDESAPKGVEILDVMEHIAAAKVTAWWGYDYILLSYREGSWMIEEVLWQGPLKPQASTHND